MSKPEAGTRTRTLSPESLRKIDAYWRAANYLSVGQIYLYDNPLLKRPLTLADVKRMLLGHWGTTPGQNFIYAHLNRVITKYDLNMIYVSGPGHGGPAVVANSYLEGSYSEIYPGISPDEAGLQKLFLQFSFPGGIPSHASPECPGSIHEGGELGYSLSHSFGAVFDNPELVVACVVGDGEAETGPLAAAWHSNKFLNPVTDGAVLPILHLNGYKIANPTVLARIEPEELDQFLRGNGWTPHYVEGNEPALMHEAMAVTRKIRRTLAQARQAADALSIKRQESLKNDAHALNQSIRRRGQQEVLAIARKALMDLASTSLESRMVEVFSHRLGELDGPAKEDLAKALKSASEPARVRSAFDLPAKQRAAIQNAVNTALSADIRLRFETAPDVVCGIELSTDGRKVAWSITDYLASLAKGVDELLKESEMAEVGAAPKSETKGR